jgi:hypothetical protein
MNSVNEYLGATRMQSKQHRYLPYTAPVPLT